jgi:hypothetical protein
MWFIYGHLSTAFIIYHPMVGYCENGEMERTRKKGSWPILTSYPRICLEGQMKTINNLI